MKLQTLFDELDIDSAAFQKGVLGIAVESRSDAIQPEHLLAGLLHLPQGYTFRRLRRLLLKPRNIIEVIKASVENPEISLPPISSLENAPSNRGTENILRKFADWQAEEDNKAVKLRERDFLSLVLSELNPQTIEDLENYAQIDWEQFTANQSWPPSPVGSIQLWNSKTGALLTNSAFDKSGRKLIIALEAEMKGLGLRDYTAEALFIALLTIEPSILAQALQTQFINKDAYVSNSKDLVMDFRNRVRKPRALMEIRETSKDNCHPRLLNIFEGAAEVAIHDGKSKISVRDASEALVRSEAKGILGNILKQFNIDLEAVLSFLETYSEEPETEVERIAIGDLEPAIKKYIIGQDHAVERIIPLVKRLRFGYRRPGKPAGVFLFMGPSGTGKTQMAKTLAKILYGSEDNMVMLEMGQFGAEHSRSMFIGAPPGYVGYGEGKLTNGIRDNPESVILFDEVEKAHPSVLDVLLRFLDEGKIDDPAGPVRDGSNCLIVLTSNFLADEISKYEEKMTSHEKADQEAVYRELREALLNVGSSGRDESVRKFFRPEFIFRIDEIILYRSFSWDDYRKIAELNLAQEIEHFKDQYNYDLEYDELLLDKIADDSFKRRNEGARVINRVVNVKVVNPLIDFLTENPDSDFEKLKLSFDEKTEQIQVVPLS